MYSLEGLLDEWWPVQPHGNRHKYQCYLDMLEQNKAYNFYNGVVCRCGLDVYIERHTSPKERMYNAANPTINERGNLHG